jgi:hypothetical protein
MFIKKGVVIATAVAGSLLLAGCASQGSGGSACGEPTAVPVAAPAPMNTCKNVSSCKQVVRHHHHRHHAAAKKVVDSSSTTTTTTSAATTTDGASTSGTTGTAGTGTTTGGTN